MENFNAGNAIQDLQFFGEFGGVNPSISDSSTYTFLSAKSMADTFEGKTEGCFLYSRHTSPSNHHLSQALAKMEGTESATVTASGMGAITASLLQLCKAGDHIISSRTIYGGTYAFMKNFLPGLQISTTFLDINDLEMVEKSITKNTKVLFCESVSNPLLEIADISALSAIAKKHNLKLIVDNTFSPLSLAPHFLGADVIIHSLTKFINGSSDAVGGVVCASSEFIEALKDVNSGACMLLGATLDSLRAASILKNLRTLAIRVAKHSHNALFLAEKFEKDGLIVKYPGLKSHPQYEQYTQKINEEFGYGGLLTLDVKTAEKANLLMEMLQHENLGYLAVSLGFYKTLFSASGSSTSSEISDEEQKEMHLSPGLIRFSIGLDHDIERTYEKMKACMEKAAVYSNSPLAHLNFN